MASDPPLVSIGMPLYNEEQYLRTSLDSLLRQDYPNLELVISDNASTDSTETICREYGKRDRRIRYHRQACNRGGAWNFNEAFHLSRGSYFMWAAGHDCWEPKFLSTCLGALEREPAAVLSYPRSRLIDPNGNEIERTSSYIDTRHMGIVARFNLAVWWLVNPQAIYGLMRADALRKTRLAQPVFAADQVLLAELSLLGPFVHVPETLFYPREQRETSRGRALTRSDIRGQLARLSPSGAAQGAACYRLRHFYEALRGAVHAKVRWAVKPILIGSVVAAYCGGWYKYIPSAIRRPIRNRFRSKSGIVEGRA